MAHPLLDYILKLAEKHSDLPDWIDGLSEEGIEIESFGHATKTQIQYYYQKYVLLLENGYFEEIDQGEKYNAILAAEHVRKTLANVSQITFEVTDSCNLKCKYCGYGEFYSNYDMRENKKLDIQSAKLLLDYFKELWNSPLNSSHQQSVYISFYGGEPLLNFPFIKELVNYSRKLNLPRHHIVFSMTTNGILIDRYMDFLVENQFRMLISLDGEESDNAYRCYYDGKPAFTDIMRNIEALKNKYPYYFKTYVHFNAVLHNKNSVSRIFHFFKNNFEKIPSVGPLNTSGIRESMKKSFRETYSNVNESLFKSEDYTYIEQEMFIRLPNIQDLSTFLHRCNSFSYNDYNDLIFPEKKPPLFPTGTCLPFSRRVFVSVSGKLFPCERIGHQYALGWVNPNKVNIDEGKVADTYNRYFAKLKNQCGQCYLSELCFQCVFYLEPNAKLPKCRGFMNRETYTRLFGKYIDFLEQKPYIYSKVFEEVIIE